MSKLFTRNKDGFFIRFGFDDDAKYSFNAKWGKDEYGKFICRIDFIEVMHPEKYQYGEYIEDEDLAKEPCGTIMIGNTKSLFAFKMVVDWLFNQMYRAELMKEKNDEQADS